MSISLFVRWTANADPVTGKDLAMPEMPPYPGAPRWVKTSALVVGLLALALAVLLHAGVLHGPGGHGLHHGSAANMPAHTGHQDR